MGLNFGNDSNAVIVGGLDVTNNRTDLKADGAGALTLVSIPLNPSSILGNLREVDLAFGNFATSVFAAR